MQPSRTETVKPLNGANTATIYKLLDKGHSKTLTKEDESPKIAPISYVGMRANQINVESNKHLLDDIRGLHTMLAQKKEKIKSNEVRFVVDTTYTLLDKSISEQMIQYENQHKRLYEIVRTRIAELQKPVHDTATLKDLASQIDDLINELNKSKQKMKELISKGIKACDDMMSQLTEADKKDLRDVQKTIAQPVSSAEISTPRKT